jgi:hypothetical protein
MPDHPHTLAHWDDAVRDEVVADGGNLLDKVSPVVSSQRSMVWGWSAIINAKPGCRLAIGGGSRSRPAPRRRFMRASSRRSSPASVFLKQENRLGTAPHPSG